MTDTARLIEAAEACPFCGSHDLLMTHAADNWPVVQCQDCGAQGPCIKLSENEALTQWNQRPACAPPAASPVAPAAAGVVETWEDEHGRERKERRRTARELQDPRIDHLFCGFDNMILNAEDDYTKGYLRAMRQEFAALAASAQPNNLAPPSAEGGR